VVLWLLELLDSHLELLGHLASLQHLALLEPLEHHLVLLEHPENLVVL
jgi:hypothetical protein